MARLYSQKRNAEIEVLPWIHQVLLWTSLATAFAFLVMAYYLPNKGAAFTAITFILLGISLLIVFVTSILNFFKDNDEDIVLYEDMVHAKLVPYFETLNNEKYRKRGLEWYVFFYQQLD